jgi:hypothetical protein
MTTICSFNSRITFNTRFLPRSDLLGLIRFARGIRIPLVTTATQSTIEFAMKPIVKLLVTIAGLMLLTATISSVTLYDVLGLEPVYLSIGSINLLVIAMAFRGIQSWAVFDSQMHAFEDARGDSQWWSIIAQLGAALSLIAFVFAAISVVTSSRVFGSLQIAWMTASVNVALLSIVVSGSLKSLEKSAK